MPHLLPGAVVFALMLVEEKTVNKWSYNESMIIDGNRGCEQEEQKFTKRKSRLDLV